jgi:hypothetical protein
MTVIMGILIILVFMKHRFSKVYLFLSSGKKGRREGPYTAGPLRKSDLVFETIFSNGFKIASHQETSDIFWSSTQLKILVAIEERIC